MGWDDVFLVFFWVLIFTGLRAAVMDCILVPVAQMAAIRKKKSQVRFAEQAWIFVYSTAFWSLGMVTSRYLLFGVWGLTSVAVPDVQSELLVQFWRTLG